MATTQMNFENMVKETNHILYDPIHMKCPEKAKLDSQKVDEWLSTTGMGIKCKR